MDDTTLLLISTSGVELLRLNLSKKQIKSTKSISIDIEWYKFSFASGLLFLCCSPTRERIRVVLVRPPKSLQKLYKFQMQSEVSDGKRVSVPIESNEFFLANMYNRLFAIHVDTRHTLASVYGVGRERLDFKHSFALLPGRVAVSVVDNVLIFHNLDQKVRPHATYRRLHPALDRGVNV
jgi:regulator of MON1-CCZ1 complex